MHILYFKSICSKCAIFNEFWNSFKISLRDSFKERGNYDITYFLHFKNVELKHSIFKSDDLLWSEYLLNNARTHLKKFHGNDSTISSKLYKFECQQCYSRFKSSEILKSHIQSKHEDNKVKVCFIYILEKMIFYNL